MSRLVFLLAILAVAASSTPVLAQDSGVRQQSTAILVHPVERQPASPPPMTGQTAGSESRRDRVDWPQVGMGVTVAVGNLFYIPAKIAYGTLGSVAGGAAYVFTRGDRQTAHRIWRNSLGGDYVLTPSMVTEQEPLHFMGSASSSSTAAIPAQPIRGGTSSGRVNLPQSVAAANTANATSLAAPRQIDAEHGYPATLEIPPLVDGQSGRSEAKDESTAPGVARTPESESMPPMRIEPQ
jgi:hypothetical protein